MNLAHPWCVHFLAQRFLDTGCSWYVSQYVDPRHGGYKTKSGNVEIIFKIPRNGMKMMDKENGILWHFVAQHKISIKLITLKIYATSYTRLDAGGTKPNQVSTTGAPHDLIWCFYTYYLVSPDHFNMNLFFVAALRSSEPTPFKNWRVKLAQNFSRFKNDIWMKNIISNKNFKNFKISFEMKWCI